MTKNDLCLIVPKIKSFRDRWTYESPIQTHLYRLPCLWRLMSCVVVVHFLSVGSQSKSPQTPTPPTPKPRSTFSVSPQTQQRHRGQRSTLTHTQLQIVSEGRSSGAQVMFKTSTTKTQVMSQELIQFCSSAWRRTAHWQTHSLAQWGTWT